MYRLATRRLLQRQRPLTQAQRSNRCFSTTLQRCSEPTKIHNILGGGPAPPVQVRGITAEGIELADGLILPSACVFLDGNVFLWDVPSTLWSGWGKERFELFEVVVPKPGMFTLYSAYYVSKDTLFARNINSWDWKARVSSTTFYQDVLEQYRYPARRHGHGEHSVSFKH